MHGNARFIARDDGLVTCCTAAVASVDRRHDEEHTRFAHTFHRLEHMQAPESSLALNLKTQLLTAMEPRTGTWSKNFHPVCFTKVA